MNGYHLSGGTIAALISFVAARYGWHVSDAEATVFGATAAGIGAAFAHILTGPGLWPAIRAALFGAAVKK